jgi:predicted amidohydrolase YtcJ
MGGELPTREWIDAVTPDTPVAVPRTDLHMFLVNSVALRLAGVDRNTPDPEGGVIVRDANGEPTGILKDNAKQFVQRVIPRATPAQEESALRSAIALAQSRGIAQVHVTETDWNAHHALRRSKVASESGMRFYSFVPLADWREIAATVEQEGRGDEWVRWGALKAVADGSLGSRTALFRKPYTDDAHTSGVRVMALEDLRRNVLDADQAGLHVTVHAIGDLANDDVLDVFQTVAATNGRRDRRFRVEHAQHLRPASIPRFARQGVIASVQPYHAIDDGRWAVKRIGEARLDGTYPFASLIGSGTVVTFGSDWPVAPLDPISGIHAAVTRETIDGANPGGWLPEQKVTVEQALVAYTVANAYAGFQEHLVGRIALDHLADIVVIDRDLTRIPAEEIQRARILATYVGGQARYEA